MQKLNENVATRESPTAERKRIPMSVPVRRLEVPEIPGYHLHWFNGDRARIQRAMDGGYEFVDERDMRLIQGGLGSISTHSGNTDLGSQVSVASGTDEDGNPVRMILMKIKLEWYNEDQLLVDKRNQSVADALVGGQIAGDKENPSDSTNFRYVGSRTKIPDMFRNKSVGKKS